MSRKQKLESSERTNVTAIRNDAGKIIKYTFEIYQRDTTPFSGELTRETMESIKALYTNKGAGLTQAQTYTAMADVFDMYTLHQFQQIIRAFKITKADSPFADHTIEELSNEELHDRLFRIKKTASIRKADARRFKDTEKLCADLQKENIKLTEKLNSLNNLSASISLNNSTPWQPIQVDSDKNLIIYLSDMHIGCRVDNDAMYNNKYDEEEVRRRLQTIYNHIWSLYKFCNGIKTITVVNLGDTLDGMDMQTTRRDHLLPQNMNNKEQMTCAVSSIFDFMKALADLGCEDIQYYAVGSSNHGGDMEWAVQKTLEANLSKIGIKATIFDKFIGTFDIDDVTVICCHGKDSRDMTKPLPPTINDRTENFINQYIVTNSIINKKILFVKGDSHVSAKTMAKGFIYKSVGCFVGNTAWSSINFGNTPPVCEYSIVSGSYIIDGSIDLK